MKALKKLFTLVLIGISLITIVGCSDHGHSHSGEDKNPQAKHDTLK